MIIQPSKKKKKKKESIPYGTLINEKKPNM